MPEPTAFNPPHLPFASPVAAPQPAALHDPAYDWLGVESTHPLTWLPSVSAMAGASPC